MVATTALSDITVWPDCSSGLTAPAAAQTGPYLIEGYGTATAKAYGLPNCAAVAEATLTLGSAVEQELMFQIITNDDGTMTVISTPAS